MSIEFKKENKDMHMADALLSPVVATTMYGFSAVAAGVSINKLNREGFGAKSIDSTASLKVDLPQMAVMSALVFAGQMVNYTIPGTGSSGHLCGGMMLTGILGPYAGFLSMIVVLLIQCLFFADGGLMALGANVWNMAFYGCFVGYFLIYRPIMTAGRKGNASSKKSDRIRIILASILGCVLTLQLGAFSVVIETSLSGITELAFLPFMALMQPIHLAIGLVEGFITAAVLMFVYENRPQMLMAVAEDEMDNFTKSVGRVVIILAAVVLVTAGGFSLLASSNPDGLEWSLFGNEENGYSSNMGIDEETFAGQGSFYETSESITGKTAFLPDYAFSNDADNPVGTSVSGIVGSIMVAVVASIICVIGSAVRKRKIGSAG